VDLKSAESSSFVLHRKKKHFCLHEESDFDSNLSFKNISLRGSYVEGLLLCEVYFKHEKRLKYNQMAVLKRSN